jgi:hypothetical protein
MARQPSAALRRDNWCDARTAGNSIRHVAYIVKENRTYHQVLGDLPQGNGDSSLAIYGHKVTPNDHRLAEQFVLLDN